MKTNKKNKKSSISLKTYPFIVVLFVILVVYSFITNIGLKETKASIKLLQTEYMQMQTYIQ